MSGADDRMIADWLRGAPDEAALSAIVRDHDERLAADALARHLSDVDGRSSHAIAMRRVLTELQHPLWTTGGDLVWSWGSGPVHHLRLTTGQLDRRPQPDDGEKPRPEAWTRLVSGTIPWSGFGKAPASWFFDRLTFHDASMDGLWLDPWGGDATLFLQLDLVWNQLVPEPFDTVALRLHRVFANTWSATPSDFPTIHDASSRSLETEERERLLDGADLEAHLVGWGDGHRPHPAESDPLYLTRLDTVVGDTLTILHAGEAQLLFLTADGRWAGMVPGDPSS